MKSKRVLIISMFFILIISLTSIAFAGEDITNGIKLDKSQIKQFENAGNTIFSLVRTVGIISSVEGLMIIGIRYMLGSIEEKAEYKKTLPVYVIGCLLIFAITSLVSILYNWVESL